MIIALVGPMGTGKTCTATAIAYTENVKNGKKVLANYHLNFPYTLFSPAWLLAHMSNPEEISNCVMIWDEGMQGLDSSVRSKFSRLVLYFVAQTRKRTVDMYVCCHALDELDKRLRRKIDVCGTCSGVEEEPCKGCEGTNPDNPERGSGFTKPGKGICAKCAGTGHAEATTEIDCRSCGGSGKVNVESEFEGEDSQEMMCGVCSGSGKITVKSGNGKVCPNCDGTGKGDVCPRCLGYGKAGWYTTTFVDYRRTRGWGQRRTSSIKVHGPAFWPLYDTNELIPFTAKQMRIPLAEL